MTKIQDLWNQWMLPIRDGIYGASGESFAARLSFSGGSKVEVLEEFSLDEMMENDPEEVTSIDITNKVEWSGAYFFAGEGSYGSEGFFGRETSDGELMWVAYFEEGNPFRDIEVRDGVVGFTSTAGFTVYADADSVRFRPVSVDEGSA
ncbi:hypothetical protein [Saccharopolyspora gregorii]|uniref:hypothetical protein n=1 Tax=Saccharopolyspora gregorii TaxID=33914 RepID=UPI0021AD3F45|nr:hypothetical protein [Saccharopolyspora gregorii]